MRELERQEARGKKTSWTRTGGRLRRKAEYESTDEEDSDNWSAIRTPTRNLQSTPTRQQPTTSSSRGSDSDKRSSSFSEFRLKGRQNPTSTTTKTIILNANSSVSYPPPEKFTRETNVHDWIKEVELYIKLTGVTDKKKTIFWAYLDTETRKMLSSVKFDSNGDIATEQLKKKLVELFGQRQRDALDLVKEFTMRKQKRDENVRIFCLELEAFNKQCESRRPDQRNSVNGQAGTEKPQGFGQQTDSSSHQQNTNQQSSFQGPDTSRCYNCKEVGHPRWRCLNRDRGPSQGGNPSSGQQPNTTVGSV